MASKEVDAVITGNCGPKALQTLSAAKIEVFVGQSGTTMLSKEERLKRLKDQADELRQQIEDLESSMKALDEK